MFAPAVRLASDSQIAAKRRAMPFMQRGVGIASGLATLAGAPSTWGALTSTAIEYRQGVSGDATAEGAFDRLISRADPERGRGMDASTLADQFRDSAAEFEDWIAGAQATLDGPESAGFLSELAASSAGSLVIATGLTAHAIVGIKPPPSTSGRDDADIAAAAKRAKSLKIGFTVGVTAVVILAGIGLYFYLS